jgi:hypothetical protein
MSAISTGKAQPFANPPATRIFGIRAGDFGLFASMLIAVALGFIAFFGVTFLAIFSLLIYNSAGDHHVTLDTSYKLYGLTAGILVLAISIVTLLAVWLRRQLRGR